MGHPEAKLAAPGKGVVKGREKRRLTGDLESGKNKPQETVLDFSG